jgi:O-antigen/teichoic acid export membrane protein
MEAIVKFTPLEWSHAIAFILGGLFGLVSMEFGLWPWGLIVGAVGTWVRIVIEYRAIRQFRRDVLDRWFLSGAES